jgi:hypothetical protein
MQVISEKWTLVIPCPHCSCTLKIEADDLMRDSWSGDTACTCIGCKKRIVICEMPNRNEGMVVVPAGWLPHKN